MKNLILRLLLLIVSSLFCVEAYGKYPISAEITMKNKEIIKGYVLFPFDDEVPNVFFRKDLNSDIEKIKAKNIDFIVFKKNSHTLLVKRMRVYNKDKLYRSQNWYSLQNVCPDFVVYRSFASIDYYDEDNNFKFSSYELANLNIFVQLNNADFPSHIGIVDVGYATLKAISAKRRLTNFKEIFKNDPKALILVGNKESLTEEELDQLLMTLCQ